MNGSEDDRIFCSGAYCKRTHHYERTGKYDEHCNAIMRSPGGFQGEKWYCKDCWQIVTGKQRIVELEAEVKELKRKAAWADWLLENSWLARMVKHILHGGGYEARLEEGLKTILAHAGSAIECCDEPGAGYLRDVCEIVDQVFGIDTSHEWEDDEADYA